MTDLSDELETAREDPVGVVKAVVAQVREDDVPFMAGSIAYQAFVSLVPILVLLFFFVTVVGDEALARRVVTLTEGVLPANAQDLLRNAIASEGGVGGVGASIIGLVTLVWGALKIFRGLDTAFSQIYDTEAENSLVDQVRDGVVVFAALVIGITGMVVAGSVFAAFEGLAARALNLAVLVGGLTLAFLPMYHYFPDTDVGWLNALPGAAFAAVGWTLLQFLFQLYLSASGSGGSSGIIGAVLLLLTWLYLSGLVLLVGGVLNAVLFESDEETGAAARTQELSERLHRERDRRRTLQYEVARLERELETERNTDYEALRARNRQLRRRLRWEEQSLPARLVLRLMGVTPADQSG